jgi:hypothetical protein
MKTCLTDGCNTRLFGKGKYCCACAEIRKRKSTYESKIAKSKAKKYENYLKKDLEEQMTVVKESRKWYDDHPAIPKEEADALDHAQFQFNKQVTVRISNKFDAGRSLADKPMVNGRFPWCAIKHEITPIQCVPGKRERLLYFNF